MSLPLCTPEKLECVRNIEVKNEECLQQCSGFWMEEEKEKEKEKEYSKEKIKKLSKQYWKNKGFYQFSNYLGIFSHIILILCIYIS